MTPRRVVLAMDSTEIPVYAQRQNSTHNGHFESTYYHPLLLAEGHLTGRLFGAMLRRMEALPVPTG